MFRVARLGDESALARLAPLVSPTAEHWDRIGLLFDATVGLDAAGRAAFLDRECAGNPTLRAEVDSLLRAADEAGDFIGASIARAASDFQPRSALIGTTLGAWRLTCAIGEGGMGTVYLAECADAQYRAHAAVKLLRGGQAPSSGALRSQGPIRRGDHASRRCAADRPPGARQ